MTRPTVKSPLPLTADNTVKYTGDRADIEKGKTGTVSRTFNNFRVNGENHCMVNVQWADGSYDYPSSLVLEKVE